MILFEIGSLVVGGAVGFFFDRGDGIHHPRLAAGSLSSLLGRFGGPC